MADDAPAYPQESSESADEFAKKLRARVSDGFAMISMGLGSKLGLFDVMATFDVPKTSDEIAEAAGYKERYVREWLGAMVTSDILKLDETAEKYYLPSHRKMALTKGGQAGPCSQGIFLVVQSQRDLEKCFKPAGPLGLPYSSYPGIHEYFPNITPSINPWDHLQRVFTMAPGFLKKLEAGAKVGDFCSGIGQFACLVAEKFAKTEVCGLDMSRECIASAQAEANQRGLQNVHFKLQDICSMPSEWNMKWDIVLMSDGAHDVPYTYRMLREVYRVMKPGGYFIMIEPGVHSELKDNIDVPKARWVYSFSLFHCMPVSLFEGGQGLGAAWGMEKAGQQLEKTGFNIIAHDMAHFICQKPE